MSITAESASAEDSKENIQLPTSGDAHASVGFHYECALRCLWLLELRGTKNRLSIAEGGDVKILCRDGRAIYRRAEKREGAPLAFDESFRAFVERAYQRFLLDNSVRHEFYTNQAIPSGGSKLRNGKRLNSANNKVRESAPLQTGLFCNTVYLYPERYHTELSLMFLMVKEQFCGFIDSAFPGCKALKFVSDQVIYEFAAKLLAFENEFWSQNTSVAWCDVDARLGLDHLIKDLYSRSLADGALVPFATWPTVGEGGSDDERIRAIEGVRDGSAISRARIDHMVWPLIDDWWARTWKEDVKPKDNDYLLVVLAGEHGTGKTWGLMGIGNQMSEKFNGICICVAAASPADRPFAFGNLAISQPGPCAILIDGLFPDWSRLVSCITGPYAHPLLFIGTATWPDDEEDLRRLVQRLGRRVKVVVLPNHLDETEAEDLTCSFGVSVRVAALSRAKASNIRHLAQILSGISASELMDAMLGLLANIETLHIIGPILLCTSVGVKVPKELVERSVGRPLPPELQPWILGSGGADGEHLSFKYPDEAAELLVQTLGTELYERMQDWFSQFIHHINPKRVAERAFARHLFGKLARKNPLLCEYLLDSYPSKLNAIMAREPLWALMFSWMPILERSRSEDSLNLAFTNMAAPTTIDEMAVLVEAYGADTVYQRLNKWMTRLAPWNPEPLAQFVESVMALPKDRRGDTARKLTRMLVDLPRAVFDRTLSQRECFQIATNLAGDYGRPNHRRTFLYRVGVMIGVLLESGEEPKLNWFTASLKLTERIIQQERSYLAIKIIREIFVKEKMKYDAEKHYNACFRQEQALIHRPLINLGLRLLRPGRGLRSLDFLPPVTGRLVSLAASWADDEEWQTVADAFVELLESLSAGEVSFNKLASVALPAFSGMRKAPPQLSERFLKALVSWIPTEKKFATAETAKLVLQVIGFVATQPWIDAPLQIKARAALLKVAGQSSQFEITAGSMLMDLCASLNIPAPASQRVRMPDKWMMDYSLVNAYMTQVGRIGWGKKKRVALAKQMIFLWHDMMKSRQYLAEVLLRLGDFNSAKRYVKEIARGAPKYPDPMAYLAIISVKTGHARKAMHYLTKVGLIQDEYKCGLRPHMANWMHRELAGVCTGKRRIMHLLCVELSQKCPLRPYKEVIEI